MEALCGHYHHCKACGSTTKSLVRKQTWYKNPHCFLSNHSQNRPYTSLIMAVLTLLKDIIISFFLAGSFSSVLFSSLLACFLSTPTKIAGYFHKNDTKNYFISLHFSSTNVRKEFLTFLSTACQHSTFIASSESTNYSLFCFLNTQVL